MAVRTSLLAKVAGHAQPSNRLLAEILKGTGLNTVLIYGSGEFYRIKALNSRIQSLSVATAIVLTDRLFGIVTLATLGALFFVIAGHKVTVGFYSFSPAVWCLLSLALLGVVWLGRRSLVRFIGAALSLVGRRDLLSLLLTVLISGCIYFTWVASIIALAKALNISVPTHFFFYAAPLVMIAAMIPISIGGVGIREAGYVVLLAPFSVPAGAAVALGVAQYLMLVVISSLGLLLWLIEVRGKPRRLIV